MRVLLTGATGLLGNNVLRACLAEDYQVAVIVRNGSDSRPFHGLNVEKFNADLAEEADNDGKVIREALDHVDLMIHCAGLIQIGWSRLEQSMKLNRDATEVIANCCRVRGVKLIHVSSVDALAAGSQDRPATEDDVDPPKVETSYVVSKRAADEKVWEQIGNGLSGMIVHPGLMFGPWDWKPSSGQMITAISKQFVPFAPPGGISVCDVRDVAAGILSAAKHGRIGESYILAGENIGYLELWQRIAKFLNRKAPWGKLPGWLGQTVGTLSDFAFKFKKHELETNSGGIKMGQAFNWYSSDKAKRELGYQIGSVDQALQDAVEWLRAYGYIG